MNCEVRFCLILGLNTRVLEWDCGSVMGLGFCNGAVGPVMGLGFCNEFCNGAGVL